MSELYNELLSALSEIADIEKNSKLKRYIQNIQDEQTKSACEDKASDERTIDSKRQNQN